MRKYRFLLLLIIPLLVFTVNVIFVRYQDRVHFNMCDPAYAYLYNGLNMAQGKIVIGHVDNPGTTVQTSAALFIRVIYTFSGSQENICSDVLKNPEKYLRLIFYFWILLACAVLFFCGRKIYRVSGNIGLPLLFQSTVLVFFNVFVSMADLRPEGFLAWGCLILVTTCFSFLAEKEIPPRRMLIYGFKFGVILAFLLVTKITSAPLLLIPLFLLRNWKSWLVYFLSTCVFCVAFFAPALPKSQYFYYWAKGLIFHSGMYGSGKENIVDPAVFRQGLTYIFTSDTAYVLIFALLFCTLIYLAFSRRINFSRLKTDAGLRLLIGIFITEIFCSVFVAKQLKFHYLIPGYSLMMLGAYLAFQQIRAAGGTFGAFISGKKLQAFAVPLFCFSYFVFNTANFPFHLHAVNPKQETMDVMAKYKDVPRLYITYEYYGAEPEPALYFGLCYSGDCRYDYMPILKKNYPNTYFYSFPEKQFHDWSGPLEFGDILAQHEKLLVSFYYTDPYVVQQTLDHLDSMNIPRRVLHLEKVYENRKTGEQLYELTRIGKFSNIPDSSRVILCDAENAEGPSLVSADGHYSFQGAEARSNAEFHSGHYALALTQQKQYGFVFHLTADKKMHYEIQVWRKSESGEGVLLANGKSSSDLYFSSSQIVETGENGWEKIRLRFTVPANYPDSLLSVGAWNEGRNQTVYFDDFKLIEY